MNQLWTVAVTNLLDGSLDLLLDPLAVSAWSDCYFSATDANVTDLYGTQVPVDAVALENVRVNGRELEADALTFPAIPETHSIAVLVLHRSDTGGLIGYIDQRPDLAPLFVQGNGGPVTFTWGGSGGATVISL